MALIPRPQEIYRHFKGNLYQIITIAEHSETGEPLVVYQALYGDFRIYARPLAMFLSKVDRTKYPECRQEYRFERQDPDRLSPITNTAAAYDPAGNCAPTRENTSSGQHTSSQEKLQGQESTLPQKAIPVREHTSSQEGSLTREHTLHQTDNAEIEASEELTLDPMVLEFLDADSYEQRLNILAGLHHRITNEMITTMAIACDIEVDDGDLEERYDALRTCLLTLEKYECNRLR